MSTQFKCIAAHLEKAWKTRQEFLFGEKSLISQQAQNT